MLDKLLSKTKSKESLEKLFTDAGTTFAAMTEVEEYSHN